MSNEVARLRPTELQTTQPANVPTAVESITGSITGALREAISTMQADDVYIELVADQSRNRGYTKLSVRAYRRGKQILAEDRDA
jgi:hypothetical protein